jgi:hypothetical protein
MKSGRGGKRVGAGRPVQDEDRGKLHTYTVRLYPDQWEYLGRFGNRSMALRLFIDNDKK